VGMGGLKQLLFRLNHSLGGRMLIGPAIGISRFWSAELIDLVKGDERKAKAWAVFLVSCVLIYFYVGWCGMPFWQYVALIAYPGISLALVRSYCEHQAAENVDHRTIIVECSLFWSFLFLNNNLHVPHHDKPALAWYKLPEYYRRRRAELIAQNNGYLMSYLDIFRQYFFTAKEPIAYPDLNWLKH
jgi:fatty acid desaturase